jgi:hypothetical protein
MGNVPELALADVRSHLAPDETLSLPDARRAPLHLTHELQHLLKVKAAAGLLL